MRVIRRSGSTRRGVLGAVVALVAALLAIGAPAAAAPPATCFGMAATITGTAGDDFLTGTPGVDVIVGLDGDDFIRGLSNDDKLCGGPGNDIILAGGGADMVSGGPGNDDISGGVGADVVSGNAGDDMVRGGIGDDILMGGAGDDGMRGNKGNDFMFGGSGADVLLGGDGVDDARGGPGSDTCEDAESRQSCQFTTKLQFLSVSDWHGQLDPLGVFGVGDFGGAAVLSTYFDMERAANPNTLTLTAGDAYGASPPLSNFFQERTAVEAMNLMGFDVDTFGNHNFDKGTAHLQKMINLAEFDYVSANLDNLSDPGGLKNVEPYQIYDVGGAKVAVIGITNPEAPTLVFPGSFGPIVITDPVTAAMDAKAAAAAEGAEFFVAITHLGVTSFDASGDPQGPVVDFANGVTGFDVIFGDHTDVEFGGFINGVLVVENRSKGRTYAKVNMRVKAGEDPAVEQIVLDFVEPFSDAVVPDPAIEAFLAPFRTELDGLLSSVLGQSTVFIPRADECGTSSGRTCESLVGDVTTDALRDRYGTDFAITNSGGLRADLTCPTVDDPSDFCPPYGGGDFDITDGSVLTVLPFGNSAVTYSLSGAELKAMLENGVSAMPGINGRFAQVSGLCFTYDIDAAPGSRVTGAVMQDADGSCSATAVDLTAATTYTMASNDFMATGGDGYPVFIDRATTRELLDQVLADYVADNSPISPSINGRINCFSSGGVNACPVPLP